MNYRHIYHAGNFADVAKHAVLAMIIECLKQKDAPFRVIDTHAGIGGYDLSSEEAQKTGEWLGGIGRLIGPNAGPLPPDIADLIEPYLAVVRAANPPGVLAQYPGSPQIARALLRPQDILVANELHPEDGARLRRSFGRDDQVKVLALDGWMAVKSLLPPKERRGVILIDPPFEQPGEFDRLVDALAQGTKRFANGIYMLWYPIKEPAAVDSFIRRLSGLGLPKLLRVELLLAPAAGDGSPDRLAGSGLIVHNPPYRLDERLDRLLPWLAERLGNGRGRCVVERMG